MKIYNCDKSGQNKEFLCEAEGDTLADAISDMAGASGLNIEVVEVNGNIATCINHEADDGECYIYGTSKKKTFFTEDTETGTVIDEFQTREEAEDAIQGYYKEDKINGSFSEGFYTVRNSETDELEVVYSSLTRMFCANDYHFKVPGVTLEDGEIEILENGRHAFAWPDFDGGTMEIGEWTYMEPVDGKLVMVDESEAPNSTRRAVRRFESGESVAGALFAGMRSAMLA